MATIMGTNLDDVLMGTVLNDQMYGLQGSDLLEHFSTR